MVFVLIHYAKCALPKSYDGTAVNAENGGSNRRTAENGEICSVAINPASTEVAGIIGADADDGAHESTVPSLDNGKISATRINSGRAVEGGFGLDDDGDDKRNMSLVDAGETFAMPINTGSADGGDLGIDNDDGSGGGGSADDSIMSLVDDGEISTTPTVS